MFVCLMTLLIARIQSVASSSRMIMNNGVEGFGRKRPWLADLLLFLKDRGKSQNLQLTFWHRSFTFKF